MRATVSGLRAATQGDRPADEDRAARSMTRQVLFALAAIAVLAVVFLSATAHAVLLIDDMSAKADAERARIALSQTIVLDPVALEAIGQTYQLRGVRLALPAEVADAEQSLPTGRPDGRVLAWTPRRMGTEIFFAIAPLRITAAALLIAAIAFVLHRLHALARHLDRRRAAARSQALEDALTGVASRLGFNEAFQSQLESGAAAALMLLDLDGFKDVNDRLGHLGGDKLLREIAGRIKAYAQPGDLVARLGGDEFAVIRRSGVDRRALEEFASDLIHLLSAPCHVDGRVADVSVSIGIARLPDDGREADALIRAADAALYRAKAGRGGCVEFAISDAKRALNLTPRSAA
jgi:diguanylate cyclase (GGDEF)-like protein